MKKLIVLILGIMLATPVWAESLSVENTLKRIPDMKQGVAYSIEDGDFEYLSTVELANYKGFNIEAGYSSSISILPYPAYTPALSSIKSRIGRVTPKSLNLTMS